MAITIPILSEFNDKGIKDAEGAFAKIGGVAKKAALAMAAVGAAGVAVGAKLIAAGERAATANARISSIAESMGLFGEGTENASTSVAELTNRLTSLAEKTALQTGVDQNQIKLTQAKLLTFKELATTADELGGSFDRATAAAIDMAAAGFGSAEMNAVQLGKALNDPIKGITALTRSGITFTEAEKELIATLVESGKTLEAQDMILEAIEKQVGGTAKATANASDRMKVAFSLLQERLGQKLLPIFERFTNFVINRAIPGIERFVELFRTEGLAGIGRVISEAMPKVMEQLEKLGNAFLEWIGPRIGPMLKKIGELIGAAADWLFNEGLPMLVDKLVQLGNALVEWIGPNIQPMLKKLGEFLIALTEWIITTAVPKLAEAALKLGVALTKWAGKLLPDVLKGLGQLFIDLVAALPGLFMDLLKLAGKLGGDVGKAIIDGIVEGVKALINMGTDAARGFVNAIIGFVNKQLIDRINSLLEFSIPVPFSPDIKINPPDIPRIPMLADGGIVTGPTLAMVGEAGPEAVIPLSGAKSLMGGITINVQGSVITEGDLVETVRRGLVKSQRNGAQLVYSNV